MSNTDLSSLPQTPAGATDVQAPAFPLATGSAAETWPTACPICGAATKWKLSGRGKHYGQLCTAHGFVAIRRNPILGESQPAPRLTLWQRIGYCIFGLPNTQCSATRTNDAGRCT